MKEEVKLIPIESIRILNPRHREQKKFQAIVQSIKNLGLKKPIKVSLRTAAEGAEPGYDLVAGQGRIEACMVLGYKEIPAIVVAVSKEDRLLMSLVENMARRFPAPMDLIVEIQRLKSEGYSNSAIGEKLDIGNTMVGGLLTLMKSGEMRLLEATLQNKVSVGVAIDIAKAEGVEAQRELLAAYEKGQLNQYSIRTLRRVMEQAALAREEMFPGVQTIPPFRRCHGQYLSPGNAASKQLYSTGTGLRQQADLHCVSVAQTHGRREFYQSAESRGTVDHA